MKQRSGGEKGLPSVAAIMPCRNEIKYIDAAVTSVLEFDYPRERLSLTVVDGMSDDGTRTRLDAIAACEPRVSILDNPDLLPSHALNRAIEATDAEVILRLDAHSVYPADYARSCVDVLLETGAWNVGGIVITHPAAKTPVAEAIAFAMAHPFGVGTSSFRIGAEGRKRVETVPFGCWRREVLRELGGFATDIPYAEDDELNARIVARGGDVVLDPTIKVAYIARDTLRALALQMFRYGRYKPVSGRRLGRVTTWRQTVPPAFVAAIGISALTAVLWPPMGIIGVALLAIHLFAGCLVAARATCNLGLAAALRLPVVFFSMHAAYGAGYLRGLASLLIERGRE